MYVAVNHCHTHLQQRVNSVLLTENPAVENVRFFLSCFAAAVCQPKIQSQSNLCTKPLKQVISRPSIQNLSGMRVWEPLRP